MRELSGWQNPNLELRDSPIHGKGVFSTVKIGRGEVILRMGGLIISKSEFREDIHCRFSTVSISDSTFLTRYLAESKSIDDFINHSCSPNSWLDGEFSIVAKSQIEVGHEVTIDYAVWLDHPEYRPMGPCCCGSVNCRSWVTGQDWQRMDVVRNNYGHLMPYLNGRINDELDTLSMLRT